MIFDKLGERDHQTIQIDHTMLWIVPYLVAIPAMLNVEQCGLVQYGSDRGSGQRVSPGRQIVEKDFQGSVANSTLIIVHAVEQHDRCSIQGLRSGTAATDLDCITGHTVPRRSIVHLLYSDTVLQSYILQIGPQIRPAESQVNQSAFMLWGKPALQAAELGIHSFRFRGVQYHQRSTACGPAEL